jgi:tRNA pseudouridine38-40 synthase
LLPRSIRVTRTEEAAAGFHARFQAVAKTYEYRIYREEVCPPIDRLYVFHHPYPLDEAAVADCARVLTGEHDFSAFAAADEKDELGHSKVRTIYSLETRREGGLLTLRTRGSGFLKHQVRMMVGTLLEVGKGNLSAADVTARLDPGFCGKAGPAVPASGLFLISVEY